MPVFTIGIAGCGVAGLASALLLHRDGHRVTLFERFEAPRPLGSGLMIQSTGLAVLRVLGLGDAIVAAGARIERLFGQAVPSERTVLDVRYAALRDPAVFGIGIHRAALFDVLHRAVLAAGISIQSNRTVTSAPLVAGGKRELVFADGARAGPFDLLVDTLGIGSPLVSDEGHRLPYGALWASLDWVDGAGFDPHALEQRYVQAHTMAGVLPIGTAPGQAAPQTAFFWSLRGDKLEAWRARGLEPWKDDVLRVWPQVAPLLAQIDTPERLTFATYIHRTLRAPAERALVHIGDAWHATSPQLGQGANMALLDALALQLALRETDDVSTAALRAIKMRRRHVALYQAMSYLFTPVYQSDSVVLPLVRDRIAGPLTNIWPATAILAAMVGGFIGAPLRPLGLSRNAKRRAP